MYPLPVYNGNTRARRMGPPRAFSFTQGNQPSLLFDAMGGTAVLGRGGQAPTFTRATVATITDQDLVVRQVVSGEVRFGGFRRVENLLLATEDFTQINGGDNAFNTNTANSVTFTNAAGFRYKAAKGGLTSGIVGHTYVGRVVLSSTDKAKIGLGITGSSTVQISLTSTPTVYSVTWVASTTSLEWGLDNRVGNGGDGTTTGTITCTKWQLEDVTGQSNQNPAEYVSVGVLSAPYQGANVDGVQYFPYLNGNTVASNVVTEARGATISSSILGGYLPEPAATDLLNARADARDMTTANWTGGATIVRSRTATGADGVANKATILQAGAVAATNTVLTTITAAASTRTYSVLLKRGSGTGPVRITQDGFATSTDVSGLINSTTFTLIQIAQSQLNAQIGIKVDTNGDTVIADWNQFSAGDLTGLVNSRIPDTITTRNADVLTYATTGWLNAAAGTLYGEFFNISVAVSSICASLNDATANNYIDVRSTGGTTSQITVVTGGAAQSVLAGAAITASAVAKMVNVYQANDFAGYANNNSAGTDAAGTIPTVTRLEIGSVAGGNHLGHYVRKVAYYGIRMVNESGKALTA